MAHVHIGERIDKRRVQVIYHIPIDSPKEGIVPTPKSCIDSQLTTYEREALSNGSIVEVTKTISIDSKITRDEFVERLKEVWRSLRNSITDEYYSRYKFFGETIEDATT